MREPVGQAEPIDVSPEKLEERRGPLHRSAVEPAGARREGDRGPRLRIQEPGRDHSIGSEPEADRVR